MAKVRLTVTTVYEYEIKPQYYDNCETDLERMQHDLENYNDDPGMLELMDCKSMKITGEIIEEGAPK